MTNNDVYIAFRDDDQDISQEQKNNYSTFIPMIDESPLLYSCVTREGSILAERLNSDGGNVRSCILALLQTSKFDQPETYFERAELSGEFLMERFSISYGGDFVVHVVVCDPWRPTTSKDPTSQPLTFMVVAEREVGIVTAFGFLQELVEAVHEEYKDHPEIPRRALHGSLQRDLDHSLEALNEYWSSESAKVAPEVAHMRGQINGVKEVMMSNLDEMIRRKDQIDVLVHKTELLENDTVSYRRTATALQRHEWWRNNRWYFYLAGILLAAFAILYAIH